MRLSTKKSVGLKFIAAICTLLSLATVGVSASAGQTASLLVNRESAPLQITTLGRSSPHSKGTLYNLESNRRQVGEVRCGVPNFGIPSKDFVAFADGIGCRQGLKALQEYFDRGIMSPLPGWYCTGFSGGIGTLILCRTGVNPVTNPQRFDIVNADTPHARAWEGP
jgi:hypothetical protein